MRWKKKEEKTYNEYRIYIELELTRRGYTWYPRAKGYVYTHGANQDLLIKLNGTNETGWYPITSHEKAGETIKQILEKIDEMIERTEEAISREVNEIKKEFDKELCKKGFQRDV